MQMNIIFNTIIGHRRINKHHVLFLSKVVVPEGKRRKKGEKWFWNSSHEQNIEANSSLPDDKF